MPQYHFPSGMQIPGFDVGPWFAGLQIVLACLSVAALVVFVGRCFQKVSLWDIPGWIALVATEWMVLSFVSKYLIFVADNSLIQGSLMLCFALTNVLALLAVNVVVVRYVNHTARNLALLGCEFIGLCWLASPTLGHPAWVQHRQQCKNHLKQIGLAMHNYHDMYNSFPPAGHDADVLTWRIALLPYVDEKPLHQQFHLDEPWNSPHNTTLQEKRPNVYRCPSHPTEKRFTSYAMLRGPGTAGGDGTVGVPMKAMRDGTSSTALVVEACGREIVWTEPKDVEAFGDALGVNLPGDQPGQSRGAIASYHRGGAHVLLADGSVRHLSDKIDPNVIRMLSTYDDGEPVPEY